MAMADVDLEQIESLVQSRSRGPATKAIRKFLRQHRHSESSILQACDWLKRLGMIETALKLVLPLPPAYRNISTATHEGKIRLQAANLLNQLGASEFALNLIKHLEPVTFDDLRRAAQIRFSNFDSHGALELYRRMMKSEMNPTCYSRRLAQIEYADALNATGKFDQAIRIVKDVERQSEESLLRGIALQAHGEYLASVQRFEEALSRLRAAESTMHEEEETVDSGLVYKWLAYVLAELGHKALSLKYFQRAERILRNPSLRPEAYLDLVRLKARVHPVRSHELNRLYHYPGLLPGFSRILEQEEGYSGGCCWFGEEREKPRWTIDFASDEVWLRDKVTLGIPMEFRLLGALGIVGDWGISLIRVQSFLWPDDLSSFLLLKGRVFSLLHRLRARFGVRFRVDQNQIFLSPPCLRQIRVCTSGKTLERPSFLERHSAFGRQAVEKYYSISATSAKAHIRYWIQKKWIQAVGSGRTQTYKTVL